MSHTPAPWHIGGPSPISGWCVFNKPFGLGDVADVREKADAMLIAAAPDLLAALRDLLERVDINGGIGEYKSGPAFAVKNARLAIAKATGEES